jgi:hypothetical protein
MNDEDCLVRFHLSFTPTEKLNWLSKEELFTLLLVLKLVGFSASSKAIVVTFALWVVEITF